MWWCMGTQASALLTLIESKLSGPSISAATHGMCIAAQSAIAESNIVPMDTASSPVLLRANNGRFRKQLPWPPYQPPTNTRRFPRKLYYTPNGGCTHTGCRTWLKARGKLPERWCKSRVYDRKGGGTHCKRHS